MYFKDSRTVVNWQKMLQEQFVEEWYFNAYVTVQP